MRYGHVTEGTFISRPNRFIAWVETGGRLEKVHVKNTGRCGELLTEGVRVILSDAGSFGRATRFDLVAAEKDGELINIDSSAPNKAAGEWLLGGGLYPGLSLLKPETRYGESRLDFYAEAGERRIFIEVKGVTLRRGRGAFFPDAPSQRALRHVDELMRAAKEGYEAVLLFVVQMKNVDYAAPNRWTQPEFAQSLIRAEEAGVRLIARDCVVRIDGMEISEELPVRTAGEEQMGRELLSWYNGHRRILPWREEPTPYHVWVSEIMLQQTRVEAVKPYYDRFIQALPDVASLAGAEEETLLKLWEGLGYYNRVRNMQKAAREVMTRFGGQLPRDMEELLSLPGIGAYTAGAVSSIAYGKRAPAVDGNVLRVMARLNGDESDISRQAVKERVAGQVMGLMPEERPGDFNQAMMELGATVCLPQGAPLCGECPLAPECLAHRLGCPEDLPRKAAKKERVVEEKTVLIIQDAENTAIRKRTGEGLLAGMYEFPMLEGHARREEVEDYLAGMGLNPLRITSLEPAKHVFSHREWRMIGYAVRVDELDRPKPCPAREEFLFVKPEETEKKYPIPTALAAYARYARIRTGRAGMKKDGE